MLNKIRDWLVGLSDVELNLDKPKEFKSRPPQRGLFRKPHRPLVARRSAMPVFKVK